MKGIAYDMWRKGIEVSQALMALLYGKAWLRELKMATHQVTK